MGFGSNTRLMSHMKGANGTDLHLPIQSTGHTSIVYSVAFLPDGDQFISSSMDGTVRTWDAAQAHELGPAIDCNGPVSTMTVSADGRWIATGSHEERRIYLWDARTHAKVGVSEPARANGSGHSHAGAIECLAFSADASRIASGSGDATVIVWRVPTGERLAGPFRGHVEEVASVAFSPDGDRLASTDRHHVRIQESLSGNLSLPLIELEVGSLVWASPSDDRLLYAACSNRIVGIDASTGAVVLQWTAHLLTITCLALSQDGQLIAASSNYARTVQIWNTATQQECVPALQHGSSVRCVAISPDGTHVVTGGEDSSVYIWQIRRDFSRSGDITSQSAATFVDVDDGDDPDSTTTTLVKGPNHNNTNKRFPNDLTDQITRDNHDPVASGGFADIYRGTFQENGRSIKVAIKVIKTYSGEEEDLAKKQKRLRREIKVWLNLRHVNVLPLLGTITGFGRLPAMVCPWAENGPLTSYLEGRHRTLSVVDILGLLHGVACGLQYLHSRSVVHGDLSGVGSNVLICENGKTYISDFGLSMLLTELGGSTFATSFHARGTLRWTAPELLDLEVPEDGMEEESPRVGPTMQSDVYSFGGVMLQILSGKVPYHYYGREAQVVHAVSRGMTPRRPSSALVTEQRWAFMERCWSTVDVARSRPSSEEIAKFTGEELASACAL